MTKLEWTTESWTGENLVLREGDRKLGVLQTSVWNTSKNSFQGQEMSISFRSAGILKSQLKVFSDKVLLGVLEPGFFSTFFIAANGTKYDWTTNFWGESPAWVNENKHKLVAFKKKSVLSSSSGTIYVHENISRSLGMTLAVCGLLVQRQLTTNLVSGIS
jgi:hypothetical protein